MRRFLQKAFFGTLFVATFGMAMTGCRPAVEPDTRTPSVTVSPSVTTPLTGALPSVPDASDSEMPAAAETPAQADEQAAAAEKSAPPAGMKLVAIDIELPAPAFRGTPVPLEEPNVEKPRGGPRPPFLAPEGTLNLARGRIVSTSDPMPVAGELDFVTDGAKEASDFGYLELHPGTQWIQIDLGQKADVYAILIWHNHAEARVYRDVVVQVSDDPDFLTAQTVFNNDYDNSSGLGIGKDMGYVETSEGKLIDAKGVQGRYVRVYGKGNNIDGKNHYTEVEVFGRPVK